MTISVWAYVKDEHTGKLITLDSAPGKQLAGVEATRTELWGSNVMEELGLVILPSLREANVDVQGEQLEQLEYEALTILQNINLILPRVRYDESTIRQRTQNIIDAVRRAKELNGGVVIW